MLDLEKRKVTEHVEMRWSTRDFIWERSWQRPSVHAKISGDPLSELLANSRNTSNSSAFHRLLSCALNKSNGTSISTDLKHAKSPQSYRLRAETSRPKAGSPRKGSQTSGNQAKDVGETSTRKMTEI